MTLVSYRSSVSQIAAQVKAGIHGGTWREWLPNERKLARELQVSRSTLRLALTQLGQAKVTTPVHGVGHRIVEQVRRPLPGDVRSLGLLAPAPLTELRPSIELWISELKSLLHKLNFELHFYSGKTPYSLAPGRALQRLTQRNVHAGWILVLSTEQIQHWFAEHDVTCVVAGSLFPGVSLPSCDLDYRAICRHAVGVLHRAGHRKIVLFERRNRCAGEIESERGFLEAASTVDVEATIVHHDDTLDSAIRVLRKLCQQEVPPTGLIVANSNYYLAIITELARHGWRVPEQISLISRDDDPFLEFIVPSPARYRNVPLMVAAKLRTLALQLVSPGVAAKKTIRIVPQFFPGGSVDRPPSHAPGRQRLNVDGLNNPRPMKKG